VSKTTILRLLIDVGDHAAELLDSQMVGIQSKRIQVDELWTFNHTKQKQLREGDNPEFGDQYVFIAMDADTKLVPLWRVGKRDGVLARSFMHDLAARIVTRFQLSTDSFSPYYQAVDEVWGAEGMCQS
jgi:IS1 family transposase